MCKEGFTGSVPFLMAGEIVKFPSDASFFQPFDERVDNLVRIAELRHTRAAVDDDEMLWSASNARLYFPFIYGLFGIIVESNSAK